MYKIKTKNGFTLVELLAVIVVLSIILVIASASIIGTINNSRNNAFMVSFDNLVDSVKNNIMQKKTNKNLQVECAERGSVNGRYSELDYCNKIYNYEKSDYNIYVMKSDINDVYYVFMEGIGKFSKVDISKYGNELIGKSLIPINHNREFSNNSLATIISKNGKTLDYEEIVKILKINIDIE